MVGIRFLTDSRIWRFGDKGESGEAKGEVTGSLPSKPRSQAPRRSALDENRSRLQRAEVLGRLMSDATSRSFGIPILSQESSNPFLY